MQKHISDVRSQKLKEYGLNCDFQFETFDDLVKSHPGIEINTLKFPLTYHFGESEKDKTALFINGRIPNEPFSLRKCKMTKMQYNKHNSNVSFRECLDIESELKRLTDGTYEGNCAKCNTFVKKKSLSLPSERFIHIDHFGEKQFINIKNEFMSIYNLTNEDKLPEKLIPEWIKYHNENAKLRILCNICNCAQHRDI